HAKRVEWRGRLDVLDLDLRDLGRIRHQELHERGVAQLAVRVVSESLVKRAAYALRHAAFDLALDHHRVDDLAAVVDHHVLEALEAISLRIDPQPRGVAPRGPGRAGRAEVAGRLEAGLLAVGQRRTGSGPWRELGGGLGAPSEGVPDGVRQHRDRGQRDATLRRAFHSN